MSTGRHARKGPNPAKKGRTRDAHDVTSDLRHSTDIMINDGSSPVARGGMGEPQPVVPVLHGGSHEIKQESASAGKKDCPASRDARRRQITLRYADKLGRAPRT